MISHAVQPGHDLVFNEPRVVPDADPKHTPVVPDPQPEFPDPLTPDPEPGVPFVDPD